MIRVESCLTGRLRPVYPVATHDVEIRLDGVAPDDLEDVLRDASERVLSSDPRCRKVVFATHVGDLHAMVAAEAAGFRYVVDVDVPDDGGALELSLLVREPASVTRVDMYLDRVPGT
ncbi:hypothetical protein [Dactylosporangium sp. CA-233914]|uniref:hypothetical protein n=1 Tax=Dactylosporangium sp. CA-233914 TaxID=3239934 RepID=UPI003D911EF9